MSDPTPIDRQIAELEQTLQDLKKKNNASAANETVTPPPLPWETTGHEQKTEADAGVEPPPLPGSHSDASGSFESRTVNWFSRIGVGLVLFGLAWLFKLSIVNHWFTPTVWVGVGFLLGSGFVIFGLKLRGDRPVLSQSLIGGGQAIFYVTIFAAYTWCHLISHPVAFCLMVLVTGGGFWLASCLDAIAPAMIGMIGGFSTPFLLYAGEGNIPALVVYTVVILAGALALFWRRNWLSLLPVAALGSLAVFATAYDRLHAGDTTARVAMESGFVLWWLLLWLVPCFKRIAWVEIDEKRSRQLEGLISVLAMALPVITLAYTAGIWTISKHSAGTLAFGASVLYLVVWRKFQSLQRGMLALTHLMAGIALFTVGMILCLKGNAVFFVVLVQSLILHESERRNRLTGWAWLAHLSSAVLGVWLLFRYFDSVEGTPILNATGFLNLLAVFSGFAIWRVRLKEWTGLIYWIATNLLLLGWSCREFSAAHNGLAWITVFWGIHGFALVLWGYRAGCPMLKISAYTVLILAVSKLIFCDLATVADVWRVLLLLGFGGVFLLMSYLLPKLGADNGQRGA